MKLHKDSEFHFPSFYPSKIPPPHKHVQDKKIFVAIPEDLEFMEAETSVLSKSLIFVPVNNKIDKN